MGLLGNEVQQYQWVEFRHMQAQTVDMTVNEMMSVRDPQGPNHNRGGELWGLTGKKKTTIKVWLHTLGLATELEVRGEKWIQVQQGSCHLNPPLLSTLHWRRCVTPDLWHEATLLWDPLHSNLTLKRSHFLVYAYSGEYLTWAREHGKQDSVGDWLRQLAKFSEQDSRKNMR